ncbi:MAG: four helix bundle protein [Pirellulales bacterium]|nr:four helix bundle protein [Pirellulales bacterium]
MAGMIDRTLTAWQEAMNLAETTCGITKTLPQVELFYLSSQLRRTAVFYFFQHHRRARATTRR